MSNKLKIGAVVYDPKVTIIWGIIGEFFASDGTPVECVFYKDYTAQVDALIKKEIDIAWNSPLAWLDTHLRTDGKCLYGSMRDTDQDRKTCLIVRRDCGITAVSGLKGKTIGFGALDSPQARLIPSNHMYKRGLEYGKDYVEKRFDIGIGLHGDHVGGELDAVKSLAAGEVDAAFTLDLNWQTWQKTGIVDEKQLTCLETTDPFDHWIFSGHPELDPDCFNAWLKVLHRMDYNNPDHQKMMDMEGLKKWVPGRLSGFQQIQEANKYLNFIKN